MSERPHASVPTGPRDGRLGGERTGGVPVSPGLPPEAYASALAGLPQMGPARLAAVLDVAPPDEAWARVREGRSWSELRVVEVLRRDGDALVAAWRQAAATVDVARGWRRVVESGIGVVRRGRPGYPPALADDVEPPAVLFAKGRLSALDGHPRVAVVGTRRCTNVGRGVAFELGRDLTAAGVSVVSGLANGIDAAAHRGSLTNGDGLHGGAPPVGVVGSGLDVVYPPAQTSLWHAVAAAGVLLSEAPLGAPPERWRFPARNRIIAALADVVVVVESHPRGGALHTVDEADRRGIDVMAVPGSVRSSAAAGVNALLVEGRAPARDADDVLLALGLSPAGRRQPRDRRPEPSSEDRAVLDALGWQPASLDQLALRTGLALPPLAAALERLRAGAWISQSGGWYEQVAPGAVAGARDLTPGEVPEEVGS